MSDRRRRKQPTQFRKKVKRLKGTPLFMAREFGYRCPNDHDHRISWSEYEGHIWCYDCEEDIPSEKCHFVQPNWMDDERWNDFLKNLPFEPILPEEVDSDGDHKRERV